MQIISAAITNVNQMFFFVFYYFFFSLFRPLPTIKHLRSAAPRESGASPPSSPLNGSMKEKGGAGGQGQQSGKVLGQPN
jgi:hypothetical protein